MSENDEEVALPFIQLSNGKFVVDEQAGKTLSAFKGKLAVVCVAGPYRTGKSFLLNRLIGRQNGFKVGGSVNSCTKGIWLWGEGVREEGSEFRTIFLDSEGLGSIEQSATFDVQIFSLSLLLSSLFVLNTQGTINESALEQLELVVECTRAIQAQESKGEADTFDENYRGGDLAPHFPDFLWVLRDFMLELADTSGSSMTARQYLDKCLEDLPGNRKRTDEKNRLRQTLRTVFARRDCDTLVRPVHDERQLQKLHEIPYESLRKEFRDQMDSLRNKVLRSAPAKAVDGVYVNGAALVKLAEAYCHALNSGGVPVVRSAWQSVMDLQMRDGMDAAVSWFEKRLQKAFEVEATCFSQEDLDELLHQVEMECANLILEHLVGEEAFKQAAIHNFHTKTQAIKTSWIKANIQRARALGRQGIEKFWKESGLEEKIQSEAMGEAVLKEMEALITRSLTSLPGPMLVKEEICRLFLQYVLGVLSRALSKQQLRCSGLIDEVAELKQTVTLSTEAHSRAREEFSSQIIRLQAEVGFATERFQHEQSEKKHLETALATANSSLTQAESARSELAVKLTFEQIALKQALEDAQQKKTKWHTKFELLNESLTSSREQTKVTEAALEKARNQFRTEIGVLNQTAEATNQALQDANLYITELEAQAKNRDAELQEAEGKVSERTAESQETAKMLANLRDQLAESASVNEELKEDISRIQEEAREEIDKANEVIETTQNELASHKKQLLSQSQEHESKHGELTAKIKEMQQEREKLEHTLESVRTSATERENSSRGLQVAELACERKRVDELLASEQKAQAKMSEMESAAMQQQQKLSSFVLEQQEQTLALKQERVKTQELTSRLDSMEKLSKQKLAQITEQKEEALSQTRARCKELEKLIQTQQEEMESMRKEAEIIRQTTQSPLSLQIGEDFASLSRLKQELEVESARNSVSYQNLQSKLAQCKTSLPFTKRALSAPVTETQTFKMPKTKQELQDDKNKSALLLPQSYPAPVGSPGPSSSAGVRQLGSWLTSPSRQV